MKGWTQNFRYFWPSLPGENHSIKELPRTGDFLQMYKKLAMVWCWQIELKMQQFITKEVETPRMIKLVANITV